MKLLELFAVVVVALTGVNAASSSSCPIQPMSGPTFVCWAQTPRAECLINPCQVKQCPAGRVCCPNYTKGCDIDCLSVGFQCPVFPANVNCLTNPCDVNKCAANKICCPIYTRGCDYACLTP